MITNEAGGQAMGELLRRYAEAEDKARPYREALEPVEAEIKALRGEITTLATEIAVEAGVMSHKESGVTVDWRRGYTRVKWDSKALDGYAVAHPEIGAFRSETEIKPSVTIKYTPVSPGPPKSWAEVFSRVVAAVDQAEEEAKRSVEDALLKGLEPKIARSPDGLIVPEEWVRRLKPAPEALLDAAEDAEDAGLPEQASIARRLARDPAFGPKIIAGTPIAVPAEWLKRTAEAAEEAEETPVKSGESASKEIGRRAIEGVLKAARAIQEDADAILEVRAIREAGSEEGPLPEIDESAYTEDSKPLPLRYILDPVLPAHPRPADPETGEPLPAPWDYPIERKGTTAEGD